MDLLLVKLWDAIREDRPHDQKGHVRRRQEEQHRNEHELGRDRPAGSDPEGNAIGNCVRGNEAKGQPGMERPPRRKQSRHGDRHQGEGGGGGDSDGALARADTTRATLSCVAQYPLELGIGFGRQPAQGRHPAWAAYRL